jgi:hypothetical protein
MRQLSIRFLVVGLVALSSACALRSASVADLQQRPGRYQDRTVTVSGVVTDSWGVPLLPYKFYRVDDGTGEIAVLSQSTKNVPGRGDRVRVRGRVENVAVFGGRSVGLHLREEDLDFRR